MKRALNRGKNTVKDIDILQRIEKFWDNQYKNYFTPEEIKDSLPLSQITKTRIIQDKNNKITDYFNVKVMVTIIATRMIAKKYIARCDIRKVTFLIHTLKS